MSFVPEVSARFARPWPCSKQTVCPASWAEKPGGAFPTPGTYEGYLCPRGSTGQETGGERRVSVSSRTCCRALGLPESSGCRGSRGGNRGGMGGPSAPTWVQWPRGLSCGRGDPGRRREVSSHAQTSGSLAQDGTWVGPARQPLEEFLLSLGPSLWGACSVAGMETERT